jgi:ubiquitin-conjugating enzyme E2 Q
MLLSITYIAAAEGVLDEPFPIGIGIRVPKPDITKVLQAPTTNAHLLNVPGATGVAQQPAPPPPRRDVFVGNDRLCDFDELSPQEVSVPPFGIIENRT